MKRSYLLDRTGNHIQYPVTNHSGREYEKGCVCVGGGGTSPVAQRVKNPPAMQEETQETQFHPWVWKIPWRKKWQPSPGFMPEKIPWTEKPGGLQSKGLQRV